MIPDYDARTLSRLLRGDTLNGEIATLSNEFKGLAEAMNSTKAEGRGQTLEDFLRFRPDRDEITDQLAQSDPDAPPSNHDLDSWEPIHWPKMPSAELFPLDVFPDPVADLARTGAKSIGCPVDFFALPILAVSAGIIGRSLSLLVKPEYFQVPVLFTAIVGPPSDGKSPALAVVCKPLRRIGEALKQEYDLAKERWKIEADSRSPSQKKLSEAGPPPRLRRVDVEDATMEVLASILADNERGLVMVKDELTGLFLGLNQYKSGGNGSDRSNLLSIWAGSCIKRDRVSNADGVPIHVQHPTLSITGAIPPDMLPEMADARSRADGLLDRFLFTFPDIMPVPRWSWDGVPEEVVERWTQVALRLWNRPLRENEGRMVPNVTQFHPPARDEWERLFNAHTAEMNAEDFDQRLRGPYGKFRDHAARLALILAALDQAADPTASDTANVTVESRHVVNAWKLVKYFKSHLARVLHAIESGPGATLGGSRETRVILNWIKEGNRTSFSLYELRQAKKSMMKSGSLNLQDLDNALMSLTKANVIRRSPVETSTDGKRGRPPLPRFEVNPDFLRGYF